APLLALRPLFAGSEAFRLFDVVGAGGGVEEDVYAYTNGVGERRALVLYNNSPHARAGRMRLSAKARTADGALVSEPLHRALGVRPAPGLDAVLTTPQGEELRVGTQALALEGLGVELGAYEARVYVEVRTEAAGAVTLSASSAECPRS